MSESMKVCEADISIATNVFSKKQAIVFGGKLAVDTYIELDLVEFDLRDLVDEQKCALGITLYAGQGPNSGIDYTISFPGLFSLSGVGQNWFIDVHKLLNRGGRVYLMSSVLEAIMEKAQLFIYREEHKDVRFCFSIDGEQAVTVRVPLKDVYEYFSDHSEGVNHSVTGSK